MVYFIPILCYAAVLLLYLPYHVQYNAHEKICTTFFVPSSHNYYITKVFIKIVYNNTASDQPVNKSMDNDFY